MIIRVPKSASKDGPQTVLRFRTKEEFNRVKKAAKITGLSMNTFFIEEILKGANLVIAAESQEKAII